MRGTVVNTHSIPQCANCAYLSASQECRKRAPIYDAYHRRTIWPLVEMDDWCGEWEPDDPDDCSVMQDVND